MDTIDSARSSQAKTSQGKMAWYTSKQNEALANVFCTIQIFISIDMTNRVFHLSFMTNYVSSSNENKPN